MTAAEERPVPPIGAPPAADTSGVEVGQVRTWTDRINQRRQGRVTLVDGAHVELSTAGGGLARVTVGMLDPLGPPVSETELAAERLAAIARAKQWLEVTLATRLEDAVTGAWDALQAIDPERDSDELKVEAAQAVATAADDLRRRVAEHVAAKQSEAAAKEKP